MDITFSMPHVFFPGSNREADDRVLSACLDFLIGLNLDYLRHNATVGLYQSRVVYGRTQIWDTIPELYSRGFGDCKSLTAALIAQHRMRGISCRPVFRYATAKDGSTMFHILVYREPTREYPHGFEDPSKKLGMLKNEFSYFKG